MSLDSSGHFIEVPHPRAWEPWLRLLGELHAHRAWDSFIQALGRGLEALTGARGITLFVGQPMGQPRAQGLIGNPAPLPPRLPDEVGEVAWDDEAACVKLYDGALGGGLWLTLVDPGRVDLAYCLPIVATTLGLMIHRVRSLGACRRQLVELLDAQRLAEPKLGQSRKAIFLTALEAVETVCEGLFPVLICDVGGRLEVCTRREGEPKTGVVRDGEVEAELRRAMDERRAVIILERLARGLALDLGRGDAPTGFYYLVPLQVLGDVDCLLGLGLPDAPRARPALTQAHDIAGFPKVSGRTLARLELMTLLRSLQAEVVAFAEGALAREEGYLQGMSREDAYLGLEIHDSALQELSYVQLQLARLEGMLPEDVPAGSIVREIHSSLRIAVRDLRELATGLTSSQRSGNLAQLLTQIVQRFESRFDGEVIANLGNAKRQAPPNVTGHMVRIVQELLNNIWKHADARTVRLDMTFETEYLQVVVRDDGRGLIGAASTDSQLGLTGIKRRVDEMGGTVSIDSAPNKGTSVEVRIPI